MNERRAKTWLRGALHARPAGLVVRLLASYDARVRIASCEREALASNMLDLLALGADEGDRVEVIAEGREATEALTALLELIERNFDQGLVPELGHVVVPGIAIGRASLVAGRSSKSAPGQTVEHEQQRAEAAIERATQGLVRLMGNLAPEEAALFAPELAIVDALAPRILAGVRAGLAADESVLAETANAAHDLFLDARARLLDALDGETDSDQGAPPTEPTVLVVRSLTPSLVARLPAAVVGLVVLAEHAREGREAAHTSHAALLARGRGLPLAFVSLSVGDAILPGVFVVIDASDAQARVWVDPDPSQLEDARSRKRQREAGRAAEAVRARAPLGHLGFAVRANVSSLSEVIPDGAEGVGLLRTELLFTGRSRPPSLTEQVNAFARIADDAKGGLVTIRLFDGGADKPLAWLPQPDREPALRGIALLFAHPEVLLTQLRAIAAVAGRTDVRILVPMTRSPRDVERVRAMARPGALVGAMIESEEAVDQAQSIARVADFVSIGTNDLAASLSFAPRESGIRAASTAVYRAVRRVVVAAAGENKPVTVCGELAAEQEAALALAGLGVNAISVAPSRFLDVKLRLLDATREDCARSAEAATA